jgi:hypothetical protein
MKAGLLQNALGTFKPGLRYTDRGMSIQRSFDSLSQAKDGPVGSHGAAG